MLIRAAETEDMEGAGLICRRVLADKLPFNYELNIGVEGCVNLVADEGGRVVGYLTMLVRRWDPRGRHLWQRLAPYVAFVGVLPDWQRQGIGGALLRAAIQQAVRLCPGESHLFLEHAPGNIASRLYQRLGFRAISAAELEQLAGLHVETPVMSYPLLAAPAGVAAPHRQG